jgi:hypothetical protein
MALLVRAGFPHSGKLGDRTRVSHDLMTDLQLPGNAQDRASLPVEFIDVLVECKTRLEHRQLLHADRLWNDLG